MKPHWLLKPRFSSVSQVPLYLKRPEELYAALVADRDRLGELAKAGSAVWVDANAEILSKAMTRLSKCPLSNDTSSLIRYILGHATVNGGVFQVTSDCESLSLFLTALTTLQNRKMSVDGETLTRLVEWIQQDFTFKISCSALRDKVYLLNACAVSGLFQDAFISNIKQSVACDILSSEEIDLPTKTCVVAFRVFSKNPNVPVLNAILKIVHSSNPHSLRDIVPILSQLRSLDKEAMSLLIKARPAYLLNLTSETLIPLVQTSDTETTVKTALLLKHLPSCVIPAQLVSAIFSDRLDMHDPTVRPHLGSLIIASLTMSTSPLTPWLSKSLPLYAKCPVMTTDDLIRTSKLLSVLSKTRGITELQDLHVVVADIVGQMLKHPSVDSATRSLANVAMALKRLDIFVPEFFEFVASNIVSKPTRLDQINNVDLYQLRDAFKAVSTHSEMQRSWSALEEYANMRRAETRQKRSTRAAESDEFVEC